MFNFGEFLDKDLGQQTLAVNLLNGGNAFTTSQLRSSVQEVHPAVPIFSSTRTIHLREPLVIVSVAFSFDLIRLNDLVNISVLGSALMAAVSTTISTTI
jgi:hypothetical protein